MNIWNKVFLGIIIVTATVVVALATLEMRIRSTGQKRVLDLTESIKKADDGIAKILAGTAPTKSRLDKAQSEWSFEELKNAVSERYHARGRAWFSCIVSGRPVEETLPPDLLQVIVQVTITGPLASSETGADTAVVFPEHLRGVVYVFDEGGEDEPGSFLGRFNVDSEPTPAQFRDDEGNQMGGYRVTLITADPLCDDEIEQILNVADSRWTIYLTPPVDRVSGIFSKLTEEEFQMIPEEIRDRLKSRPMPELTDEEKEGVDANVLAIWEKIRAEMDDPEAEAGRDFAVALDWLYKQLSDARRDIKSAESDIATFKAAEDIRNAENEKLTADGDLETKRVAAMDTQRNVVKALLEQYQAEIDKIRLQIEKLQTLNELYVAKIAEYQAQAVEEMEKRAANAVRNE